MLAKITMGCKPSTILILLPTLELSFGKQDLVLLFDTKKYLCTYHPLVEVHARLSVTNESRSFSPMQQLSLLHQTKLASLVAEPRNL